MSTLAKSLNPLILGAAVFFAFAALAKDSKPGETGPADIARQVVLSGSGFRVGADTFSIGPQAGPAQEALLTGIAGWLSAEFDFPVIDELPAVAFASARRMKGLRFRDVPSDRSANQDSDIAAVYDDEAKTIYLPYAWRGNTATDLSVLVHEMVHHMQNLNGQKFACAEEREEMAYAAQERWLELFGGNLETDFEMDPFTVLVRTKCLY